jgi:hypothetical protein
VTDSIKALSVVTILPPPQQKPGQAQVTFGTRVMLSDGSELTGVTSITLTATPGDVWQATITVRPERIEGIAAKARIIQERDPVRHQHPDVVEVTSMGETVRQWVVGSEGRLDGQTDNA